MGRNNYILPWYDVIGMSWDIVEFCCICWSCSQDLAIYVIGEEKDISQHAQIGSHGHKPYEDAAFGRALV